MGYRHDIYNNDTMSRCCKPKWRWRCESCGTMNTAQSKAKKKCNKCGFLLNDNQHLGQITELGKEQLNTTRSFWT